MTKYSASLSFIQSLGLKVPIIQAPMAGISTIALSAIVHRSGGLGSLPFGAIDLTKGIHPIINQIEEYKKLTGNSNLVNLNFFSHDFKAQISPTSNQQENWFNLFEQTIGLSSLSEKIKFSNANVSINQIESEHPEIFKQLLDYLIEFKPKVISFHFGHPSIQAIKKLQNNGTLIFVTATSVKEAKHLIDVEVDGLICQGYEAGGHRGNFLVNELLDENLSTFALFKQVKLLVDKSTHKPFIIPAGGIVDGKTIESCLSLGASAVQLGTVFLTTPESNSNNFIRDNVLNNSGISTIMTSLISGKPARTLKTEFIEKLITNYYKSSNKDQPSYGFAYSSYKQLSQLLNDANYGFYLTGQNYHLIDPKLNTHEVLMKLTQELKENGYPI